MLAAPKFLGYTEKAKVTQVKNDIVAYEKAIDTKRIDNDKYIKDWEEIDVPTMESLKKSLFNKKGLISDSNEVTFSGEYYKIPKDNELVKTHLKGDFYLGQDGEVYYYDENLENKGDNETPTEKPEHPTDKDLGYSDSDFRWIPYIYGYSVKNGQKGYFQYTGTGRSTVEIPHVIQGVPMTAYYKMFYESPSEVTKIISTNKNVTNMSYMFWNSQATSLDLSELDTSNVKDMSDMFWNSQATSLDLSSFDTSKVTNMSEMFEDSKATSITFGPKFNTSKVEDMRLMFWNSQATTLDLSSFDTSKVTDMSYMFEKSQATSITFGPKFNTSNVTDMDSMFRSSNATSLDLSSFDTSNVTNMYRMFWNSQATSITFGPNFNTSNVTNMRVMFSNSQAKTLDLSKFNTSKVTSMAYMFENSKATSLDLSSFDTSKVTNMSGMFSDSQTTTVYAGTQADADRFNASSYKPRGLKFIVGKP